MCVLDALETQLSDGSGGPQEPLPEIRPILLDSPIITIGRLPENSVVLNHPQISGYHARLEQRDGGHRLVDLGSTNHVYVNGQRITQQSLKAGDEIRIGPFKFIYTGTQLTKYDESSSIRIEAHHLKRIGNNKAVLLDDISLAIPPRKFVVIVGGSGAGKTTLMNALNGQQPAQEGTVYYNGQDYYRSLAAFNTQLGIVPQDDIMHRDLSVERALYYAAKRDPFRFCGPNEGSGTSSRSPPAHMGHPDDDDCGLWPPDSLLSQAQGCVSMILPG